MDIANSLAPRSDQLNADEIAAPITVTIREVVQGKAEQPFDFLLHETERAYRPGVTMRRLIASAWGTDAAQYVGRRLTLYRDPSIRFGPDVVGGIRISAMSHIDKQVQVRLQVKRGKRELFTVDPLPDAPATNPVADLLAQIKTAADKAGVDLATIATEWADSHDGQAIKAATDIGGLELVLSDLKVRGS